MMAADYMQLREACQKALDTWGLEFQQWMLVEECAELTFTLAKVKRFPANPEWKKALADELADVTICIHQMALAYNLDEMIGMAMERKIKRLNERIEESQYGEILDVGENNDR